MFRFNNAYDILQLTASELLRRKLCNMLAYTVTKIQVVAFTLLPTSRFIISYILSAETVENAATQTQLIKQ